MTEKTNGAAEAGAPEAMTDKGNANPTQMVNRSDADPASSAAAIRAIGKLVSEVEEKSAKTVYEGGTKNVGGVGDAPPWRMVAPAILGIIFLGLIAGLSILFITVILSSLPASGNGNETVAAQVATGLALLGSLASAAVGGIAGMLSLVFQQRRAEQGGDSK